LIGKSFRNQRIIKINFTRNPKRFNKISNLNYTRNSKNSNSVNDSRKRGLNNRFRNRNFNSFKNKVDKRNYKESDELKQYNKPDWR